MIALSLDREMRFIICPNKLTVFGIINQDIGIPCKPKGSIPISSRKDFGTVLILESAALRRLIRCQRILIHLFDESVGDPRVMKLNLPSIWRFDIPRETYMISGRLRIAAGVVSASVRGHATQCSSVGLLEMSGLRWANAIQHTGVHQLGVSVAATTR